MAQPAKVVELGDLVFLQCIEHAKDALTPAGERTRRALEHVLAPIIVPPEPVYDLRAGLAERRLATSQVRGASGAFDVGFTSPV